jgi:hypothetical protein
MTKKDLHAGGSGATRIGAVCDWLLGSLQNECILMAF